MKLSVATILLTASIKAKSANAQYPDSAEIQIGDGLPITYGDGAAECDFADDRRNEVPGLNDPDLTLEQCKAACETDADITGNLWGYSYRDADALCTCWEAAASKVCAIGATDGSDAVYGNTYCYGCREPSSMPSSMPSEAPSSQPSSMPSEQPSSMPSETPSSQPSSIPSQAPSSIPSESPSMQPSEHPSESPSCTPSIEPTAGTEINQFYADWSPSGSGCKNDGNEPNYMAADPTNYLYSTLDLCCSTNFGWNYLACMGQLDGICARSLWYPDWSGSDNGCLNDGNEPSYMTENPTYYMYGNKVDCCEQHYNWNYAECVGQTSGVNNGMYYPDFEGSDHICRNDGAQPMYMDQAPEWWMHADLKECCTTNYSWNYEDCVSSDPNAVSVANPDTDGKYYPDWLGTEHMCKNDDAQPSYMTQNPSMWMYDTIDECCEARYSWKYDECVGSSGTTTATGTSSSSTTGRWFKVDEACVESDTTNTAESWDDTFDTKAECCTNKVWWDADCEDN